MFVQIVCAPPFPDTLKGPPMKVLSLLLSAGALLASWPASALSVDSVVARVQDEIVTSFAVYEESARQEKALSARLAGKELDEALAALRNHTAVRMIEQELIYAEFQALGGTLPAALVQQRVDRFVKAQADGDRAKFEAMVEAEGMTAAEFEEKVARALAIELMVREKVGRNVDVGPTEVKEFYETHRQEFAVEPEVRVQAISIRDDGKYQGKQDEIVAGVFAELATGKPFADVARAWSEDSYAEAGGDRGWEKEGTYKGALHEILKSLEPGAYAKEALKIGTTALVIRLAERRGGDVLPLDADLQERIRDRLAQEQERVRYREFVNELRRKYFVKVFDRDLAAFWDSL